MRLKLLAFPLFVFLFMVSCTQGTEDSKLSEFPFEAPSDTMLNPFVQNQLLGRGINMGNALEAPNEGDWGVVIKDAYFDSIRVTGFQSVRIPVRWSAHAATQDPFTINAEFMDRVEHVVKAALERGFAVVLNMHHYQEIMSDPTGQTDRFLHLWQQIAEHFKYYPDRLIFEILNEPNDQLTAEKWNQLFPRTINVIRQSNPFRTLMVGTAEWGGITGLQTLTVPDSLKNIIVTFHYYNPFHFTHQGAEWVEGSSAWLGTTWTGNAQEKNAVVSDFGKVLSWSKSHNRPIYMGEFGAYSKADTDSRVAWTGFVSAQAEQLGFSWAYWEFCSGFGIYNPDTDRFYPRLLKALIP